MIVYSASKSEFRQDIMSNGIEDIILEAYKAATGRSTGRSELESWRNSLQYMDRVISSEDIPNDVAIAVEYHIPQSSKRIDFILSGQDSNYRDTAILIEL